MVFGAHTQGPASIDHTFFDGFSAGPIAPLCSFRAFACGEVALNRMGPLNFVRRRFDLQHGRTV
jgi:hypothetical protein